MQKAISGAYRRKKGLLTGDEIRGYRKEHGTDRARIKEWEDGLIQPESADHDVPTPKECAKKGLEKPDVGDQRISFLKSYDWKAHHRETNNLIGLLWDFIDRKPIIVAVFFCSFIEEDDWGKIVKPRSKGGRTTSVSIMTRKGVKKMFENWVIIIDDQRYKKFLNKYNKADLLLTGLC